MTQPTCSTCTHWQRFMEQGADGAKPAPSVLGECARFPRWEDTPETHWCGEWTAITTNTEAA